MDTLTHALSGALLARATAPATPKPSTLTLGERTVVGFLAASFPDIDWIILPLSPLMFLNVHRGVTHSLLMLPVWAVILSAIFAFAFTHLRKQTYRQRAIPCHRTFPTREENRPVLNQR
jgi:inner membrane protein